MKKIFLALSILLVFLSATLPSYAVNQGAEGDILQVMQPEELEIQLGSDFAYHGFKLDLDYGTYPETIYADEYGVLKLELGGSDKYVIRHTGKIKDTSEETTWSAAIGSAEVTDKNSETSTSEAVIESKPVDNNSARKFPFGIVIVGAIIIVLGVVAYIIEKSTSPKKDKKEKG